MPEVEMVDNLFGWCSKAKVAIAHGDLMEGVQRIFGMGILPAIAGDTFSPKDYGLALTDWTMADVQNYFDHELASWLEYFEIVGIIEILDSSIANQYTDEYGYTYANLGFDGWDLGYVQAVRGWLDTLRWMREQGIRQ
jgi:hypothetical protein